jgi:predicted ATPase
MAATATADAGSQAGLIRTPDQRVRVFVSSTLQELAAERTAVREAVAGLRLVPVMFESGARPHPPRDVYRAYLSQSQIFVGIYWQSYGWVAPGEERSGLEDEYRLSAGMPRLVYVKSPAPDRQARLADLLTSIEDDNSVSYRRFSDPAELQQLVADDLALLLSERFELTRPLADGPAPAETLPVPATPLIDREEAAAEIVDLVAGQKARLITLTGPGGVGKSRLAIEVAGRLGDSFPDGVRFVDLASVTTADLVPATVAARLGLRTSRDRLIADLVSYLRARRLMLILDNVEQLTEAAPLLAQLLAAAPAVTALVTSRTVLRLRGEYELAVPPLGIPPRDAANPLDYGSVRLFAAGARAAAPGFTLTEGNAQAVAEISRKLDGLPLAIELAAARTRLLPPQALLARLDDRMSVLTSGPRDLPERQRTLKNTLDWSFGLLSATEQALFARLGVFAGSFGWPAATAVAGDAAQMDTLSSLVDSSLIRPEPRDDEPQFSMLETIREYALSRLREAGDWPGTHDKHAAHFLALTRPAESELHGSGQLAWLNRLEPQHDNLNAALSWLLDRRRPAEAVDLLWTTWRFWWLHSYVPRAPHDDAARAALRARMVGAVFDRAWERGRTLDTASVVRYAREEASDARREAG